MNTSRYRIEPSWKVALAAIWRRDNNTLWQTTGPEFDPDTPLIG